jgi:hypothetical protein
MRFWYLSPIDPERLRNLPLMNRTGGSGPACPVARIADKEEGPAMSESQARNGSRILKVVGIVTLIGVIVAVGRIVLRVFNEKSGAPEDDHGGV